MGLALTSALLSAYSWQAFTMTIAEMRAKNYLAALKWNFEAINRYSYLRHPRHQVALTFEILLIHHPDQTRVDNKTADRIFQISEGAGGKQTALQVARIEYLVNQKRNPDEVEERLEWLKNHSMTNRTTWRLETKYALLKGDYERVARAGAFALALPDTGELFQKEIRSAVATAIHRSNQK